MPFDPLIGSALVAGASNLFGGAMQAWQSNRNINATNRANRQMAELAHTRNMEMAEYQHSKNIEMWKMQNQYNSPEEQMKRYQQAGLNPNLMYGQGTPGNASTMPQYQQVTYQPPQQDYRGKKSILAEIAGGVISSSNDVYRMKINSANAIKAQKEAEISSVNSYIAKQAKDDNLHAVFNKNGIIQQKMEQSYIDTLRKSYGIDGASEITKAWFHNMLHAGEAFITEKQRAEILKQIRILTITREAKQALQEMLKLIPGVSKIFGKKNKGTSTMTKRLGNTTYSQTKPLQ